MVSVMLSDKEIFRQKQASGQKRKQNVLKVGFKLNLKPLALDHGGQCIMPGESFFLATDIDGRFNTVAHNWTHSDNGASGRF